jgi:hypothetical protein
MENILITIIITLLLKKFYDLIKSQLECKNKIIELRRELQQERLKNEELSVKNKQLEIELEKLKHDLSIIRERLVKVETTQEFVLTKEKAALLVMSNKQFADNDRNALRRAGILFHRLSSGQFLELRNELQRKRIENRQYKVVHISSHASKDGIEFSDEIVNGQTLSEIMSGIDLLFLASCSNVDIADNLIGIVKNIITVYEEIEDKDMQEFVFNFYNELKKSFNILESYNKAITLVPHVSEFVDLRTST